ncbi:MAG: hypothetical protein AABZ14_06255 [Candidatus Margulisiibacteriota bacterium]
MVATNTLLLERKQSLRKKIGVAFAKNPEITDEMMDFLDTLIAQVSDEAQATYENQRVQNKHELREELSKELVTKGEFQIETGAIRSDILLLKTELQAEIQEVRAEIKQVETSLRAEIKLSNVKTVFQTALIILVVLLTTPGGTHLLEKVFPFLR